MVTVVSGKGDGGSEGGGGGVGCNGDPHGGVKVVVVVIHPYIDCTYIYINGYIG